MEHLQPADANSFDLYKAIHKFNNIKPFIKNDFFECDIFFSRIMATYNTFRPIRHQHSFFELHIPIAGKATYQIGNAKIHCIPGKSFLFAPNNTHSLVSYDNYYSVTVGFSFVEPVTLATEQLLEDVYTEVNCSSDISNCITYMLKTALNTNTEDHYIFNSLFSVILYDIFMQIPSFKEEIKNNSTSLDLGYFSDNTRIRTAIRYISDNIAFPLSVSDVANHLLLSTRQLNRILKTALNCSTNELINDIRIKEAKRYMTTTDFSLSKIAMMCGFNSPTHFNLTFKKITGMTPKLYRDTERCKNQEKS